MRLVLLSTVALPEEGHGRSAEEIMETLDAYDLTGSFRAASELVGCSHHMVARDVTAREAGGGWTGRWPVRS